MYPASMATDTKTTGRDSDKFMLRFPDGMREQIAHVAKLNNRSMNAEIVARLEASFSPAANNAFAWAEVARIEAEYAAAGMLYRSINTQLEEARRSLEDALAAKAPEEVLARRRSIVDANVALELPALDQWLALGRLLQECKQRAMGLDRTGNPLDVVFRRVVGDELFQASETINADMAAGSPSLVHESIEAGWNALRERRSDEDGTRATSAASTAADNAQRESKQASEDYVAAARAARNSRVSPPDRLDAVQHASAARLSAPSVGQRLEKPIPPSAEELRRELKDEEERWRAIAGEESSRATKRIGRPRKPK